jgi:hypothetical protein
LEKVIEMDPLQEVLLALVALKEEVGPLQEVLVALVALQEEFLEASVEA